MMSQNPTECPLCKGEVEFLAFGKSNGKIVEVWWCWYCEYPIEGAETTQENWEKQCQKRLEERAALGRAALVPGIFGAEFWDNWLKTFEKNLTEELKQKSPSLD
jgi:hypothetical protein